MAKMMTFRECGGEYHAEAAGLAWRVFPKATPDGTRWLGDAKCLSTGQTGPVSGRARLYSYWTAKQAMEACAADARRRYWLQPCHERRAA